MVSIDRPGTRRATTAMFRRYLQICAEAGQMGEECYPERLQLENLIWLCNRSIEAGESLPIDKLSRWLGFVQGCLLMRGLLDTDEERDASRPLFHQGYEEDGIAIPAKEQMNG